MSKISKSASKSVYITSDPPYQGGMTLWALCDFVKACDAEDIPDNVKVTAHHNHDTRHFSSVSIRHNVEITDEVFPPETEPQVSDES